MRDAATVQCVQYILLKSARPALHTRRDFCCPLWTRCHLQASRDIRHHPTSVDIYAKNWQPSQYSPHILWENLIFLNSKKMHTVPKQSISMYPHKKRGCRGWSRCIGLKVKSDIACRFYSRCTLYSTNDIQYKMAGPVVTTSVSLSGNLLNLDYFWSQSNQSVGLLKIVLLNFIRINIYDKRKQHV